MSRNKGSSKRGGKSPGGKAAPKRNAPRAGATGPSRRPLSRAKIRRRIHVGVFALFVASLVGAMWWVSSARQSDFLALADEGGEAMRERVVSEPSAGRDHVSGSINYDHRFPLSGPHNPTWVEPGVYDTPQRKERLVHALEHGNIVIYYDEPGSEVMGRLREWAGLYDNQWSGIVVTPAAGLGESIVLSAWTKRLRMDEFAPAPAAAFIDAYRGRGPENPVR